MHAGGLAGVTFVSNAHECHRIDCVVAGNAWAPMTCSAGPIHDWDNALPSYDHFPVIARMAARRGQQAGPRTFPVYDGAKLRDSAMREHLQHALNQVPLPPWELNMNGRAEQIGEAVPTAPVPCERSA